MSVHSLTNYTGYVGKCSNLHFEYGRQDPSLQFDLNTLQLPVTDLRKIFLDHYLSD